MAEVKHFYPGDLAGALDRALGWMLSRQNANVGLFAGNAVPTLSDPALVQGGLVNLTGRFSGLATETWPNIVLDPVSGASLDTQTGPDGFPINYSPSPLLSGNLFVNVLQVTTPATVTGRVLNLLDAPSAYRVDVWSRTDVFYFQGSSAIGADSTWSVPNVNAGTVVAFLMPSTAPQPELGAFTSQVTGWVSHSNTGVGAKLRDYFARVYSKTDIEYLQEDSIPIIVQDATHARFGTSLVPAPGTPTAHVIFNDPVLGEVDLFSTLQNQAVFRDLPRSTEVPPSDPDYATPGELTASNTAYIQNRSWIYDAALALIAFSVAGLWDAAGRIVARLNALREEPGYLPSLIFEDAEDGATSRWALESGGGTVSNVFDSTAPLNGSRVIAFNAAGGSATWNFTGAGLPDSTDSIVEFRFKTEIAHKFTVGVTSSTAQVTKIAFDSSTPSGYDAGTKTVTVNLALVPNAWRTMTENLDDLIKQHLPSETLVSINSFRVTALAAGEIRFDNFSAGAPQPEGSLSFSYDVYNGQVDQAYIRTGAMAWVCYAYAMYMERTADFARGAAGLEKMLQFLFSLQSTAADLRQNLIMIGWGRYQDPGYQYVPGQITAVSTEHNIDCYFAFDKAARVLPTAAQNLYDRGLITESQFNSLRATATTAASKAAQVRDAILNQLWIPPSGGVKGHFAQGASESGLDTALALDAAGSWAAMFSLEVGETARAVECLEFIHETFFLTERQILKSSDPETFNQAYEQLTPFDGFKAFADSAGGYQGAPDSVWMEGTWGALAAYLRMDGNPTLESYFNANYSGGWNAFLARLVESMKTAGSTTADRGLLAFSLAARSLPWEFAVRKALASTAWFWLTATRNDILFTTQSATPAGRALLKVPQGVEQSVRQLDGTSSIGALELEAIDGAGYLTALASGGKLEGRRVWLRAGYPGMSSTEFVTLAAQQIEAVAALPDLTGFALQCRDLKRSSKKKIFARGDDGFPISSEHPRTLLANPLDVALVVLQNELGLGQVPSQPESAWKIFDPAEWDAAGEENPTLIRPNPLLDVEEFLRWRNGVFAGYLFEFTLSQPVEAKQFLEYEIFRPLGGYWQVLADGRLSPRFFVPPLSLGAPASFNERNITLLPGVERHPIINQVTYRMDFDGTRFATELLFLDAPSLEQYGLAGQHTIESKGVKLALGGAALAGRVATRIFRRYSGLDPVTNAPNGGAAIVTASTHYLTLATEVSDAVYLTHALLPNFETGRHGVANRVHEVIEKQPDFDRGSLTYRLLDVGWVAQKHTARIAPQGTPAWSQASAAERARYMFVASDATGTYSDGTAGKTIW
jgi:hypothetical protein